jgi:hypothetical protein
VEGLRLLDIRTPAQLNRAASAQSQQEAYAAVAWNRPLYAHNCDALRSNFGEIFSRVSSDGGRSRQGKSQDRSDRLRLLLRFSCRAWASPCRPILYARIIVLLHRILPHRWGATGTTDWIGQLSASAGTCVRPASRCNKQVRQLWAGPPCIRYQLRPDQNLRLTALRCQ